MCSIAGSTKREEVSEMLDLMKHRAPDGSGIFFDDKFAIGNGRLAIVDVNAKNVAPFRFKNLVLAFNGEIYNYKDIRTTLKKLGYSFKTNTDTEVLIKAFDKWGIQCLDKLNGMFAFAIYDGKQIILARDIAGEKPLYYTEKPFRFASEAKALNFDCEELPPANYLVYDFNNSYDEEWWYPKKVEIKNPEEELEKLLEDAINIRTQTEVPYALYYSGGIDSSLISTFHNFKYKITYEDGDFEKDFKENIGKISWHLDYPVKSFSAYGLWQLAKKAKELGAKVVLSGEGADELFGGYIRYLPDALYQQAQEKFPSYAQMFLVNKTLEEWCEEEFNGNLRELLRMGDRMASAWGIENRCPFLDKRIIEFAFSLPFKYKLEGFETKKILRKILNKRMSNYKDIEKTGLYCSVNEWIGVDDKFDKEKYVDYQQISLKKYAKNRSKK